MDQIFRNLFCCHHYFLRIQMTVILTFFNTRQCRGKGKWGLPRNFTWGPPYAIGLLLWIAVKSRNLSGSHFLLNNMILSYLWKQEKNFIYFALFKTYYGEIELALLTFAAEKKKWLKNMK